MKKQAIPTQQQVPAQTVAALLQQPLCSVQTQISVPKGAGCPRADQQQNVASAFASSLKPFHSLTNSTHTPRFEAELSFGAPQIDLALEKGTLATNGLHELNPVHWRDQISALACALGLISRHQEGQPIFCFLQEDQVELIEWLSSNQINGFNIQREQLVVVTAKHRDDLLWAIEETMHSVPSVAIIAHFPTLENLAAQRLSYLAKEQHVPCLVICNHTIEGPVHARSQWSVCRKSDCTQDTTDLGLVLHQKLCLQEKDYGMSWHLSWQAADNRFSASLEQAKTLH